MSDQHAPSNTFPATSRLAPQGEMAAIWLVWGLVVAAILLTYSRLEPAELYHVSRDGLAGGLSRALVALNFPIALVAIALTMVALDALPRRAWWIGGPAIALCAFTAWPGVVDDQDLDARVINIVPAIGVVLAIGLGVAAVGRAGAGFSRPRLLDRARVVVSVIALIVSVPWFLAEIGVWGPEWVFIMERPITGSDGNVSAAVHLGHHHGLDGALFVVSAAALSRRRVRSKALSTATRLYLSLLFAYGAVNFVQDAWNEQLAKRGWVDWKIPSALNPALEPIWLVIIVITAATAVVLRHESRVEGSHPTAASTTRTPTGEPRQGAVT